MVLNNIDTLIFTCNVNDYNETLDEFITELAKAQERAKLKMTI